MGLMDYIAGDGDFRRRASVLLPGSPFFFLYDRCRTLEKRFSGLALA